MRVENYLGGDKVKKARSDLYHQLWEDLHIQIDILRSDMNTQIFDDLFTFVSDCTTSASAADMAVDGEIPAAVLVTGDFLIFCI